MTSLAWVRAEPLMVEGRGARRGQVGEVGAVADGGELALFGGEDFGEKGLS